MFFLLKFVLGQKNIDILCLALLDRVRFHKSVGELLDLRIREVKVLDFSSEEERRLLAILVRHTSAGFKARLKPEDYEVIGISLPQHIEASAAGEPARILAPDPEIWQKKK